MVFPEIGAEFSPAIEQPNRELWFTESNLRGIEITYGPHDYAEGWYVSPKEQIFTWAGMAHVRLHRNPRRGDVTRYFNWVNRFCTLVAGQKAYNEREKEYCYNQIEAPIFSPTSLERLSRMQQFALADTTSRHVHIQRFGRKVWREDYHVLKGFGKPHFVNLTGLAVALRNYSEQSRPSYGQCETSDLDGLMPSGYLQERARPKPPLLPTYIDSF